MRRLNGDGWLDLRYVLDSLLKSHIQTAGSRLSSTKMWWIVRWKALHRRQYKPAEKRKNMSRLIVCTHDKQLLLNLLTLVCVTAENLLPEWRSFSLHPQLLRALHDKGFRTPTPIQSAALPVALKNKDVIGVAQTVCSIVSFRRWFLLPNLRCEGIGQNSSIWFTYPPPSSVPTTPPQGQATATTCAHSCANARTCIASLVTSECMFK
jgi:hypothetical protein